MALPSGGPISLQSINVEIRRPAGQALTLNDADVRKLAGRPTGTISFSDLLGKTWVIREPESGDIYNRYPAGGFGFTGTYWMDLGQQTMVYWAETVIYLGPLTAGPVGYGIHTYHRGIIRVSDVSGNLWGVFRTDP